METMPKQKRVYRMREGKVFLPEWIRHRGLTAEKLAENIDAPKSAISKLINGRQKYTDEWLGRIAWGLDCEVWELYRTPPGSRQIDANELLGRMGPDAKKAAVTVLYDLAGVEKPADLFEPLDKADPALISRTPKGH